jgi:predicted unusual protein kinase regulating ubiquinone biosynthesis (AarF/ABC1/UbiB family)
VAEAIAADLRNVDLLGTILKQGFSALEPTDLVEEVRHRLTEELDYRLEARNQQMFADHYDGHPFIHVPSVYPHLSTGRVLTTELVSGASWKEMASWDQEQRNLAGETLFRFMSHSLYGLHAFNGDPHPGNYMFHGDGKVTFLDFGLVKHFTPSEMATFVAMVKAAAYDQDAVEFRRVVEDAGMLQRNAPVPDDVVGDYFTQFYANVRTDAVVTWSSEYASGIVHHIFDRSSPIAQYATVPKQFVFIQRINLGLYALLGELEATGNYRKMAEELWPFVQGPPSTPLGVAEQPWLAHSRARVAAASH